MPASISVVSNSSYPDCGTCPPPDGGAIAILVFLPGVGADVQNGRFTYTMNEDMFVSRFTARIGGDSTACCRKHLLTASYDPRQTARENASRLAGIINGLVNLEAVANPWVTRIHVHLVGFSAGGVVATQIASALDCSVRFGNVAPPNQYTFPGFDTLPHPEELPPARWWCGQSLALEIPVDVDVVTMATPFNIGGFFSPVVSFGATIGTFFAGIIDSITGSIAALADTHLTFRSSIGKNDYGGAPPACLCNFVSFVSSSVYDDSSGADKDPTQDSRLNDWSVKKVNVALGTDFGLPNLSHTSVPLHVMSNAADTIDAGCNCTQAP